MAKTVKHYEVYINIINETAGLHRVGYVPKPDYLVKDFKKVKNPSDHQHFVFKTLEDEEIFILKSTVSKMRVVTIYTVEDPCLCEGGVIVENNKCRKCGKEVQR